MNLLPVRTSCAFIFSLCLLLDPRGALAADAPVRKGVWFDGVRAGITLSDADVEAVFRYVRQSLSRERRTGHRLPELLQNDRAPRIVFLSASAGASPARVVIGTGQGFGFALRDALGRLAKFKEPGLQCWLKLDVVLEVDQPVQLSGDGVLKFNPSLRGIAFPPRLGIAFLPEQLMARLVDSKRKLQTDRLKRLLKQRNSEGAASANLQSGPWKVRIFTTASFFHDGRQILRLYRGHRFPRHIEREEILEAARAAGAYLRGAVGSDGRFAYIYDPQSNRVARDYNIVRHAGTDYSMFDLYGTTRDPELLKAATRAARYLLQRIKPYKNQKEVFCVVERGRIKLGAVALALVALAKQAEVTGDRTHLPVARGLARYLQQSQRANGEFISSRRYPDGEPLDFTSEYFPGESILGLLRLYALDQRKSWLDSAEKGARYLIEVRDRDRPTAKLPHDHWLLYALNELYGFRPRRLYFDHSMRICRSITSSQHRKPAFPDYLGSYYQTPRSTPTATRSEGLLAAYHLARKTGSKKQIQSIRDTIYLNVAFQLQTQFRPESVLYLDDPARVLGGFRESLTLFPIRIDYVQHNLSSLLVLYRHLKVQEKDLLAPPDSEPARMLTRMRQKAVGKTSAKTSLR